MTKPFPIAAVAALALPLAALPFAVQARPPSVVSAQTTYAAHVYTVSWTLSRPGQAVDVYVAPAASGEPARLKRIAAADPRGSATATDPLGDGVRPYFYVLPRGAKTGLWTATRVVPLQGAANFRDLGGYETEDGRHVVWGRLFRSNDLSGLTDADYRMLGGIGVRTVVDLRSVQERQQHPTAWKGSSPTFETSPKPAVDAGMMAPFAKGQPDPAAVSAALTDFYRKMIDSYADEYRGMFRRLLANETPIIVHCTAGKDRTGIGSALILSALGVPRRTVVADYAMSQQLLAAAQPPPGGKPDPLAEMFARLPPKVTQALLASDPAYIEAALDQATAEYGSVDAYLEKRLGVGPEQRLLLRSRYLR